MANCSVFSDFIKKGKKNDSYSKYFCYKIEEFCEMKSGEEQNRTEKKQM